jgi:hypothetical protein
MTTTATPRRRVRALIVGAVSLTAAGALAAGALAGPSGGSDPDPAGPGRPAAEAPADVSAGAEQVREPASVTGSGPGEPVLARSRHGHGGFRSRRHGPGRHFGL